MGAQRQALLAQAGVADRQKDFETAADLRSQANVLGSQMGVAAIGALSTFNPSAASRLALGQNDLQMQLAGMDPFGMGAPPSLLRQRIGLLNSQLGDLDARMAGAPDSVNANLQGTRNSLLLQRAEAFNALRSGNLSNIFSMSFGAPSGFSMAGETLADVQATGRAPRRLGGSVADMSPFTGTGALTPGAGGSSDEVKYLARIVELLERGQDAGGAAPATGAALRNAESNTPRNVQRARLNGEIP
jgi:hypothetical protein